MKVHAELCEFVLHNVSLFYAEDQSPRGEGDERCVSAADVWAALIGLFWVLVGLFWA